MSNLRSFSTELRRSYIDCALREFCIQRLLNHSIASPKTYVSTTSFPKVPKQLQKKRKIHMHSAKNFRYSKASTVTAAKRHIKGTEFSCLCYLTINKESFRQFKFRVTRYLQSILHKFFSKRPLQKLAKT